MSEPIRLLVVDDDREHSAMVIQFLRLSETYAEAHMDAADSYDGALAAMTARSYDVAFFDYWLGARDGLMRTDVLWARIGCW